MLADNAVVIHKPVNWAQLENQKYAKSTHWPIPKLTEIVKSSDKKII